MNIYPRKLELNVESSYFFRSIRVVLMLCGKDGKPLVHLLKFVKGTALCYGLGFLKVNGCGVFFFSFQSSSSDFQSLG